MTLSTEQPLDVMTDPTDPAPRFGRATVIAVVVVTVLALLAGGWWAWKTVFAWPTETAELDVGTMPNRFLIMRPGAPAPAARPDLTREGIQPIGAGMFRINSAEFSMALAPTETSYAPLRMNMARRDFLSQEQRLAMAICRESANAGFAKNLELTADQTKQLVPLRQKMNAGMIMSDDDRNKLRTLWKSWNAAKDAGAKAPIQAQLLAAMKEIGAKNADASKKLFADLANDIRKIITDAQMVKYRQLRGQAAG